MSPETWECTSETTTAQILSCHPYNLDPLVGHGYPFSQIAKNIPTTLASLDPITCPKLEIQQMYKQACHYFMSLLSSLAYHVSVARDGNQTRRFTSNYVHVLCYKLHVCMLVYYHHLHKCRLYLILVQFYIDPRGYLLPYRIDPRYIIAYANFNAKCCGSYPLIVFPREVASHSFG